MKKCIMRKALFSALFIILSLPAAIATHNRAGEITYVQISALTYEFTITTFTYTQSLADRPQLPIEWGDNTSSIAPRVTIVPLPYFYQKNIYVIRHTFPGPGVYDVVVQDPNRNYGVQNIPNSVNVVFSIRTKLVVNPAAGLNSTPVLLNPPYDKAARGYLFIHNPAAFDPDGDSLSYQLTVCTRENGRPIENYTFPRASNRFYVDSINGNLVWDVPVDTGKFNVAMEIQEWRNGKKIGAVVRDMQIEVYNTKNKPPVNGPLRDICIEAGDSISFLVTATDPDNDSLKLLASSGVFELKTCKASFTRVSSLPGFASSLFAWQTCHQNVRSQPYDVIIKSEDYNKDIFLFDIDNFRIRVLGPSPKLNSAVPQGKFIRLDWNNYGSNVISGFAIYRKEGVSSFSPDSCTAGVPLSSGFVKVGYAPGSAAGSFIDTNNGNGLQFGVEYSYIIVAVYPDGTESKASNIVVSTLIPGTPVIRNVSVRNTDLAKGSVFLSWKKPDKLDTIPANGPYEYYIYRAEGITGTQFQIIDSIQTADLNDTTYVDTLINTASKAFIYRIDLYNDAPGNRFLIGEPSLASTLFTVAAPGDRKARITLQRNVPWINTAYDIFRLNTSTMNFEQVGTTGTLQYTDTGLENGTLYTYYVRSTGGYSEPSLPQNLVNFSQIVSLTPVDNEPPCTPVLNVSSQCDSLYNTITWSFAETACLDDVAGYKIYYKFLTSEDMSLLTTLTDRNIFTYRHNPGEIVAGCYAVTAYDATGNESEKSVMVCVDSCKFYEIPNVFTPNNDGFNDRLVAKTSGLVEKVDFRLFNRNGQILFRTDNPKLDWDGTYRGNIVSPGVYFYQCDVWERRISGLETFHLSGFIHVITEKGAVASPQQTKK